MIVGIHHTAISVPDMDKAKDFYRDAFGFEPLSDTTWEPGADQIDRIVGLRSSAGRGMMLKGKNAYLELFEYTEPVAKPQDPDYPVNDHGITHFCMQVTDINAEYERLKGLGMRFHCAPEDMGTAAATYGRDPFGNVIEIYEVFDDSVAQLPPKP